MSYLKSFLRGFLRFLLLPLRLLYRRRNGVVEETGRHEIPNDALLSLVSEKLAEGHTAVIWVKGYSMRPFIEYGRDRVKLAYPKELNVGDAVLAQIAPGHYVLHRIIRMEGDEIELQGDGNVRGTEHCKQRDVCGVQSIVDRVMCAECLRNTFVRIASFWPVTPACVAEFACGGNCVPCAAGFWPSISVTYKQ